MRGRTTLAAVCLLAAGVSLAAAEPARPKVLRAESKPPRVCTTIYMPVCGWDKKGQPQTYPNECHALAAGARRIYDGTCISDITY